MISVIIFVSILMPVVILFLGIVFVDIVFIRVSFIGIVLVRMLPAVISVPVSVII